MNSKTISTGILRALGILLLIALILFFLYKIRAVVVYIILASGCCPNWQTCGKVPNR